MPQGPAWMHLKWENDERALDHLQKGGWKVNLGGVIYHPEGKQLEGEDLEAVTYLIQEWDYDYDGNMR